VRVVRTPDGGLAEGRSQPGRGAWLCAGSTDCVDLAVKKHAFSRALRGPVKQDEVATLRTKAAERARIEGRGTS